MAQSTAGEPYGEDPTYWVKWSSIWAARASGTWLRMVPATVLPMRSASTSDRVPAFMLSRTLSVSPRSSTDFQKKKRSEMPCRRSDSAWKRR